MAASVLSRLSGSFQLGQVADHHMDGGHLFPRHDHPRYRCDHGGTIGPAQGHRGFGQGVLARHQATDPRRHRVEVTGSDKFLERSAYQSLGLAAQHAGQGGIDIGHPISLMYGDADSAHLSHAPEACALIASATRRAGGCLDFLHDADHGLVFGIR